MFKYSVCASKNAALYEPVLFRGTYENAFAFAKELGATGIEIHLRNAKTDVDRTALLKCSQKTGIPVAGIATGLAKRIDGLSLITDDSNNRKAAVERIKGHLDLASDYGCAVIIGSMRGNLPTDTYKRTLCMSRLRSAMLECADYIADKNCFIVFEAINRYENNYFNTGSETLEFVNNLGSNKVKVLLDTFHMNIEETDLAAAIELLGDKLGHIHFADNTRHYPGHGTLDFLTIMGALKNINYQNWVSLEYLPLPDEHTSASRGLAYIKGIEKALTAN